MRNPRATDGTGSEGPAGSGRQMTMIPLVGTPEEIGMVWGQTNREIIARDMEADYLERAAAAGISRPTLVERSATYVRIAEEIAPHWLEEARATARAAGVPDDLYAAYAEDAVRDRFLHECTSYAVSRKHTRDRAILFHKTRDNKKRPQSACILESSRKGINKFIAVSNASALRCSMMVNEKGLAGARFPRSCSVTEEGNGARHLVETARDAGGYVRPDRLHAPPPITHAGPQETKLLSPIAHRTEYEVWNE